MLYVWILCKTMFNVTREKVPTIVEIPLIHMIHCEYNTHILGPPSRILIYYVINTYFQCVIKNGSIKVEPSVKNNKNFVGSKFFLTSDLQHHKV